MTVAAKEFRYAIELDRTGRVTADGSSPLDLDAAWTPEHLVLVGLVRCTLRVRRWPECAGANERTQRASEKHARLDAMIPGHRNSPCLLRNTAATAPYDFVMSPSPSRSISGQKSALPAVGGGMKPAKLKVLSLFRAVLFGQRTAPFGTRIMLHRVRRRMERTRIFDHRDPTIQFVCHCSPNPGRF